LSKLQQRAITKSGHTHTNWYCNLCLASTSKKSLKKQVEIQMADVDDYIKEVGDSDVDVESEVEH
jgi:hypothetical protein